MKLPTNRSSKAKQYAIGGTVAVVILALWISLPLMSSSSWDSSVSAGNPFKSQVADIGLLGTDISSETGAPGSPLSGEMIYNPATAGDNIASSLFQSGLMGDDEPVDASVDASADASASAPSASAASGAPAPSGPPAGKLKAAASLSGSNSNSMTAGGKHNKFFGGGNVKSNFAKVKPSDMKPPKVDKKKSLANLLSNTAKKSELAAKTPNMASAKDGASSAFGNAAKSGGLDLDDGAEQDTVSAGMQMGEIAQLKKNDPSLSKTKITPPAKPEDATDESEEMKQQIKMMVIKMVLQMALGAVFGVAA